MSRGACLAEMAYAKPGAIIPVTAEQMQQMQMNAYNPYAQQSMLNQQLSGLTGQMGVRQAQSNLEYESLVRQAEAMASKPKYDPVFAQKGTKQEPVNLPPRYNLKESPVKDEILPDISLSRVFKWAIVLLIALGLGKKVWATFGPKIEAQLHKALGVGE